MVVCMSVLLLCFNQCSCCVSVSAVAVFQSVLLLCFSQCSCCVSVSAVAVFQSVLFLCFSQCCCCVSVSAVAVFQSVLLLCFSQCCFCVSVSAVAVFQSVLFEAMVKNLALHDELGRPRKKELIVKVWNQKTNKVKPKVIAVVLVCLSVHLSAAIAVTSKRLERLTFACSSRSIGRREVSISHGHWRSCWLHAS